MTKPLDGITVIELARFPPAEMPGLILSDMGAEVVKIEAIDATRDQGAESRRRAAFSFTNRNKRSIALNLKAPEAQAIFQALATKADVLVEGFRPGVMARLGGDVATLQAINPRLVYCSLSGFGQTGPARDLPAHDCNYLSTAGALGLIGERDRPPAIPLNLVADAGGAAMHAAVGILLALFARERTGRGQQVDISYLDTTIALLAAAPNMRLFWSDHIAPHRGDGFLSGAYPYYAVYGTRDRKFLTIGCLEEKLWGNFCRLIGRPDLDAFRYHPDHDVRAPRPDELAAREAIAAIMATKDRDEWYELLVRSEVCVGKVYDVEEMIRDPQVVARGMVVEVPHAEHGPIKQFGIPIKLSETPGEVRSAAPFPGEQTDAVLRELGYAPARIAALRAQQVIG